MFLSIHDENIAWDQFPCFYTTRVEPCLADTPEIWTDTEMLTPHEVPNVSYAYKTTPEISLLVSPYYIYPNQWSRIYTKLVCLYFVTCVSWQIQVLVVIIITTQNWIWRETEVTKYKHTNPWNKCIPLIRTPWVGLKGVHIRGVPMCKSIPTTEAFSNLSYWHLHISLYPWNLWHQACLVIEEQHYLHVHVHVSTHPTKG